MDLVGTSQIALYLIRTMKLTIVTNIPTPYQNDLFRSLARMEGVALHVVYAGMSEPNRRWTWTQSDFTYPHEVLWRMPLPGLLGNKHTNPGILLNRSVRTADAVVVGGWSFPTVLAASLLRTAARRDWFYWIENFAYDATAPSVAHRAKAWLLNQAQGVLCVDRRCEASVLRAGVRPDAVEHFPYVSDSAAIASRTTALRAGASAVDASNASGVGDPRPLRVLFVGQLVERKGLGPAIDALGQVAGAGYLVALTIVGSGPLEGALRERSAQYPALQVHFAGFTQPEELPTHYAAADVALVPSLYDGWALVVNEGLAAGLPVVTTSTVGASDILDNGVTGFIVEPGNVGALAEVFTRIVQDPAKLERMKREAGALGASLDVSRQAKKLISFVRRRINARDSL